jgi:hypothetical protein
VSNLPSSLAEKARRRWPTNNSTDTDTTSDSGDGQPRARNGGTDDIGRWR